MARHKRNRHLSLDNNRQQPRQRQDLVGLVNLSRLQLSGNLPNNPLAVSLGTRPRRPLAPNLLLNLLRLGSERRQTLDSGVSERRRPSSPSRPLDSDVRCVFGPAIIRKLTNGIRCSRHDNARSHHRLWRIWTACSATGSTNISFRFWPTAGSSTTRPTTFLALWE